MKYYIDEKISSYSALSEIISTAHKTGIQFAFYFDNINKLRLFSDSTELLSLFDAEILETPASVKHIKAVRVRAAEKTDHQQAKRLKRFKQHTQAKGIDYNAQHKREAIRAEYDFFINIHSLSSGQYYRVYVKNKVVYKTNIGKFSSYGLSLDGSTLPLF